jgi:uncharacterized membrane protein YqjE
MNHSAEVNRSFRSLSEILGDLKSELKEFADTRITMLRAEFKENLSHLKIAAPLAALGLVLFGTASLLITAAIVALVAVFIDSTYRWFFALGSVGILWLVLGGVALYIAKREFELKRLTPQKTLAVLKGDKEWLQHEVRSEYGNGSTRKLAA